MQTLYPRKEIYQIKNIDETDYSKIVWERKEKLEKIELLLSEGCFENVALEALDIARSTYYRWKKNYKDLGLAGLENESRKPRKTRHPGWTKEIEARIYHLRKQYPLWGKQKIATMYEREYGEKISYSTTGRILKKLIKNNKIFPVKFLLHGKRDTKKRVFNNHAQRWKHGMKATKPGELVQVDHMSVYIPGYGYAKNFSATCPITKYVVYELYQEATSKNAADFLEKMKREFPFKICSVQVDGGSEFMAYFENACKNAQIPLFVLPPRSPELNGNVERGNGSVKYEFYAQYSAPTSLHVIRKNLQKYSDFYNNIRPHQGIGLLTPRRFYEVIGIGP
jgi:putative transposase